MKRLRVLENQLLVSWLNIQVRSLLTNQGVTSPSSQSDRRLANGGISSIKSSDTSSWRLGEEQFSILVYIMDVGNDLRTLVQLLLWLLPISGTVSSLPASHVNHGIPAYVGIRGGSPCAVGETTLLSCLQRYNCLIPLFIHIANMFIPVIYLHRSDPMFCKGVDFDMVAWAPYKYGLSWLASGMKMLWRPWICFHRLYLQLCNELQM